MTGRAPRRREIWYADLGETHGHEQSGARPVLVVSADHFNATPVELAIVVPLTSTERPYPAHVPLESSAAGLPRKSFAMCEQIRVISHDRLERRVSIIPKPAMATVEKTLRIMLDL